MNADHLKRYVEVYYQQKRYVTYTEIGLCKGGRLRADVVAVNMGSQIIVIETKSSVQDFKSDNKYHKYLKFADKLYLAFTDEIWAKLRGLVPKGIGVFSISSLGRIRVVQKAKTNSLKPEVRLNLLTRMAYRSGSTLSERKNKNSGAKFVALKAVEAIQALPRELKKGHKAHVIKTVVKAIETYV